MALLDNAQPQQDTSGLLANFLQSPQAMNLAASLLANSGYTTTPTSLGQALGSSFLGSQQATLDNAHKQAATQDIQAKIKAEQQKQALNEKMAQLMGAPASAQGVPYANNPGSGLLGGQMSADDYTKQLAPLLMQAGDYKTGLGLLGVGNESSYGQPVQAVGADGKLHYFVADKAGNTKQLDNFAPIPKKGTSIISDGAGGVTVEMGGMDLGGGVASPTTKTTNDLQGDITSSLNTLNNLREVAKNYKSAYLTYPGQARAAVGNLINKATGVSVDKDFRQGKTKLVNGVEQMFNVYRKDITGAAASVQELDRLKKSMLNVDMSPDEFPAAFDQFANIVESGLKMKQQLLAQGVPVGQVGKMVDATLLGQQPQAAPVQAQPQAAQPAQARNYDFIYTPGKGLSR